MKLARMDWNGLKVYYRKGTLEDPSSDEQGIAEVLKRRSYRRVRSGFDVEPGERWLDLGANIGAFALYCLSRGAGATCYEPDPECFAILEKNVAANLGLAKQHFNLQNAAVTAFPEKTLQFKTSNNPTNRYRGTVMAGGVNVPERYIDCTPVKNVYMGKLLKETFDGIKMDIEGSEGPLFDEHLLPQCRKLVLEYHTSRDAYVAHLKTRIRFLRSRFTHVMYTKAFDDAIATEAATYRPRFDQLIFCWNDKAAA